MPRGRRWLDELIVEGRMPDRKHRTPEAIAAELDAAGAHLPVLPCLGTSLAKAAGNTAIVRSRLVVRGLIERDGSRYVITDQGRAELAARGLACPMVALGTFQRHEASP